MKKRNLCLSAIALACAAGAHAQSSVTLFGIVDVNVEHFRAEGVGSLNAVGNGGLSTSRVGFRGVEDLGGGLRAGFWLEGSINPDNGTGRGTNTNNQASGAAPAVAGSAGLVFDRQAYVSLGGSWGEVRLGHDFVPNHYNSISFDPFNANGVARVGALTFSGAASGSLATGITASNSVSYWLPPNLGGFYGMAMYAAGENPSGAANSSDGKLMGARVGWVGGPLEVAGAVSHTKFASTATVGDYTHANVGASYNAGFAKFFALYNRVKVDLTGGTVRKDTWELGAHVPVGPQGRIRLSYARLNDGSAASLLNANGSQRASNDATLWGVGYVHDLSKRTALYGTYAELSNHGQGTYVVSGGPAPLPGRKSTGLEMGVRHAF
ncbi:MAG: porin Gram-negative type [Ramlibacter sp.]|nr:porin Gram-negative type [Ramlibacter sp.]